MRWEFRDCQAWRDDGMPLSTTSNEAAKAMDALAAQLMAHQDLADAGGIEATLKRLREADPDYLVSKAFVTCLTAMGSNHSTHTDATLKADLGEIVKEAKVKELTEREKLIIKGLNEQLNGNVEEAVLTWERVLWQHPKDYFTFWLPHTAYYALLGDFPRGRNSINNIMGNMRKDEPLYWYANSWKGFYEHETGLYSQCLETCKKSLNVNRDDALATHGISHVYEMISEPKKGVDHLVTTETEWNANPNHAFNTHIWWHLALNHVELGQYEEALAIFDKQIGKQFQGDNCSPSGLDLMDGASLLFRLQLEGVNVKDKWKDIRTFCEKRVGHHFSAFTDLHVVLSFFGAEDFANLNKMIDNMKETLKTCTGSMRTRMSEITLPISEALVAYSNADYDRAVDLVYPIRDKIYMVGGSEAQRDEFALFLIHSALKSTTREHNCLARALLTERQIRRQHNSPMTDRLMAKFQAVH